MKVVFFLYPSLLCFQFPKVVVGLLSTKISKKELFHGVFISRDDNSGFRRLEDDS